MMERLRIALIGCGNWGMSHAKLYSEHPKAELVCVCDLVEEKARRAAKAANLPDDRAFTDYRKMLDEVDCDAVAIVTPDFAHREYAVECANRKKHLLIEKPLATTLEDADLMMDAILKNGVRAMVDFHNRWNPPFALVKQQITSGDIGAPYSAYIRLNDQKWVAKKMLPWAAKSSILWFLGSHATDTLRWLFESEVDTVYAVQREGVLREEGVDTVDMYQYTYTFRNGCVAQVENSWITPDSNVNVNDFKCNILGTKGMYNLDLSNHNLIQRFTDTASTPDILVNNFVREVAAGFAYQSVRHFVDQMISGDPFYVSLDDAYNTTVTLLHVFEAAETGMPVKVVGLRG